MARATFGDTAADYVVTVAPGGVLRVGAAELTFWSAKTGGTQHTDLLLNGSPVTSIPVPEDGSIPEFQGPDGVTVLWADAGGSRVRMDPQSFPGGPASDEAVSTYVAGPGATRTALNSLYGHAPEGVAGRSYGMLLGAIRNDGSGWAPINDANHASSFIDSCSVDSSVLRVQHAALAAAKVGSVIAVPDEALVAAGFQIGASVAATQTTLTIYQDYRSVGDYISYNGSAFTSSNGLFTSLSFSAGILTLTHADLGSNVAALSGSATPRGGTYQCNISDAAGALTTTVIKIEFRDPAGTLITTPDTNMKAVVTHGRGGGRAQVDPSTITTAAYPLSNIWLFGVMEH